MSKIGTNPDKFIKTAAYFFIFLFTASGIMTLPLFGVSWDEALGNLFFGQRYLHYFLTRNPQYLDFNYPDLPIHARLPNLYLSPFRQSPHEFPPLADTLSAASMEIFGYQLQWLDPIDAFHMLPILLSSILLFVIFRFIGKRLDYFTAAFAILLLGTYPRFWGDMHFNGKDIPETIFFSLTIISFFTWYEQPTWRRAIISAVVFAGAMAIKGNAVFIPIMLILGVWPWQLKMPPWQKITSHLKQYIWHYAMMGILGIVIYFLIWPYLYDDPTRVLNYVRYLASQGGRQTVNQWNFDPIVQAVSTMPEATLILLISGFIFAIRNWRNANLPILRMLIVWLIFPIWRSSLPGMINFDGIRHFEEFVPAACILAGYGASSFISWIKARFNIRKVWAATILIMAVILNITVIGITYYPHLNVYYNVLVGGLSGAHNEYRFQEATDYWGSSYRLGMNWLNENVEDEAWLYVPVAGHIVDLTAPLWLRGDISVLDKQTVEELKMLDRPMYVMFVTRWSWYDSVAKYAANNLDPVYEIVIDNVPILQIYQLNDLPSLQS